MSVQPINEAPGVLPVDDPRRPEPPPRPEPATGVERPEPIYNPAEPPRESQTPLPPDASDISATARDRAAEMLREGREATTQELIAQSARDAVAASNGPAVRELLQTFSNYDNRRAVEEFGRALNASSAYGVPAGGADGVMSLAYRSDVLSEAERNGMASAIDRWFAGEGVFIPQMLAYPSSDGFRFTPVAAEAEAALRFTEVLALDDAEHIAAYLREMSLLTPLSFLFYDPTGLDVLTLYQRRDFLRLVEEMLHEIVEELRPPEGIQPRAEDLRYAFDAEGRLDFNLLEERERAIEESVQAAMDSDTTGTAGALVESVRQYGLTIVSEALDQQP